MLPGSVKDQKDQDRNAQQTYFSYILNVLNMSSEKLFRILILRGVSGRFYALVGAKLFDI